MEVCSSGSSESESDSDNHGDEVVIYHCSGEGATTFVNVSPSVDGMENSIVNDVGHSFER